MMKVIFMDQTAVIQKFPTQATSAILLMAIFIIRTMVTATITESYYWPDIEKRSLLNR
ncbi:MAG: hypothetical protein M3Q07_26975 [Pseudobdellovibrionaceae bacterium]|nr:hypothetical protein [Pseudobdellovibrionaceae bacterium]